MQEKYVIFRDLSRKSAPRTSGELFGPALTPNITETGSSATPPEPKIEILELSREEAKEVSRMAGFVAGALVMPTKLIEPVEQGKDVKANGKTTWGIDAVQADQSQFTGAGTKIAVLDTGIDKSHKAFSGVNITEKDFTTEGNGDKNGHGTHCAGTILGRDVDGLRIGVAPGASDLLVGKVLGQNGGSSEMLFEGINWAFENGADVISMSLGFNFPGMVDDLIKNRGYPADLATSLALTIYRDNLRVLDSYISTVTSPNIFTNGAVVIAAAGNESRKNIHPDYEISASIPAAAQNVISVGALHQSGNQFGVAYFSNTDPLVSAPGVDVISAKTGGGLRRLSGTSMACPHVAGLAALWWEKVRSGGVLPNATTVKSKILATTLENVFAQGTDLADRGNGLTIAP